MMFQHHFEVTKIVTNENILKEIILLLITIVIHLILTCTFAASNKF